MADKAVITVEVRHNYELVIPVVNRILFYIYTLWHDSGGAGDRSVDRLSYESDKLRRTGGDFGYKEFRLPLVAHYTMRLQSDWEPS